MAIGRIPEPGTGIPESIVDAKGDLITATAADTPARLAVGTTEHRLVAASAEATGLKYVADTTNYAIAAKGDLLVGTAADTLQALSVGTNGYTLVADSAEATGLKWAAPAGGGGMTLISTTTLSGASTTITVAANSYKYLIAFCRDVETATDVNVGVQINGITTNTYVNRIIGSNDATGATYSAETNAIYFNLVGVIGFGTNNTNNGTITFNDANSESTGKVINSIFGGIAASSVDYVSVSSARVQATGKINEIKFIQGGTQFDGGTVLLYGVS